jgi:ATP-dependent 26S proteasome regulatory subunit
MHLDGHPVAFMARSEDRGHTQISLEIMAPERSLAQAVLAKLLDQAHARNIYRGKVISVGMSEQCWPREMQIRFHELLAASRESIILPDEIMTVVERNVLGLLRHARALADAGRSARHGVLFHGPPGTGKTLAVRYLVSACRDHTVILLSGRQLGMIRESCQIARLLAPSIVVLEDVDLIAMQREHNEYTTVLHELMDEMDGLGAKTPTVFLLTTNRPEILEHALAARPGRVDQAIAFPLPNSEGRRRIFELYGRGLDLSKVTLSRWVDQTEGVSPAFIQELLRKAALFAAERGGNGQGLAVTDDDVSSAVHELVYFGGELTQKLLGYKASAEDTGK